MVFYIFSFAVGEWVVAYFSKVPKTLLGVVGLIFWLGLGASVWALCKSHKVWRVLLVSVCCFGLGFTWSDFHANQWLSHRLQDYWVGKNVTVVGIIEKLPEEEKRYTRFWLHTQQFAGQTDHKHLQLSWQKPHPPLRVGERWQLTVRLKPPHSLVNFNAPARLRSWWVQNIHGTGYVVSREYYKKIADHSAVFWLSRWRQSLQREIADTVTDPSAAATLTALTIGVEEGLSREDWQILQRTGTVHLVVIAGLHIGLMVMIAYFCGSGLWRCFPKLSVRFPAQSAGAVTAIVFALGYGALAGFNLPTQRAVVMTIILMLSRICARESETWRRILLAFLWVIALQPGALFSAGFWLSFAAVAWITYGVSGKWRHLPHWRQWLRMQWSLFLGLMPLTIYFFQQYSAISLIANPPAILWIGWVIVPLCLLAALVSTFSIAAGKYLFLMAAHLLVPLWHFLQWLAGWPFAGGDWSFSSTWILTAALIGAAWHLSPRFHSGRWLGLLGFLPLVIVHSPRPSPGAFWVTMLDVGQGLALTVQTANHLLVYDTGEHIPEGFDAGRDIITPYLVSLHAQKIDLLMVSHGDNDHSGGAGSLLSRWEVQRFLTSVPARFAGYHPQHCASGQQWQWDGVPFRVLGPAGGAHYQGNNSSCILQIGGPGHRLLLTGDIEAPAEAALMAQYGAELQSQVIIVPHHGSKTSSTEEFLRMVQPEYAGFSLGYFNRFHFPAPSVVERYRNAGVRQWFTAKNGAITIHMPISGPPLILTANPRVYFWQKD